MCSSFNIHCNSRNYIESNEIIFIISADQRLLHHCEIEKYWWYDIHYALFKCTCSNIHVGFVILYLLLSKGPRGRQQLIAILVLQFSNFYFLLNFSLCTKYNISYVFRMKIENKNYILFCYILLYSIIKIVLPAKIIFIIEFRWCYL